MKVKIISGGYGHRPNCGASPVLVLAGSCIEVSDAEGERLIALGVAENVSVSATGEIATNAVGICKDVPCVDMAEDGLLIEGKETAHLDAEQLSGFTKAKLLDLAEEMGIECSDRMTKAQIIDAIVSEPLDVEEVDADSEDTPPDLGVEAPVV